MSGSKIERDAVFEIDALVDGRIALLEPLAERIGDFITPHFAQQLEPLHVVAVPFDVDGFGGRRDAIVHFVITGGTRNSHHEMADVVSAPSDAREHAAKDFCALVARALTGIMRLEHTRDRELAD